MARPSSGMELLRSDVRRRLLEILAEPPHRAGSPRATRERGLSAAELAEILGLHVTTVRFHVDQLVRAGILVARNDRPTRAGRPRKLYALPTMSLQPPDDPAAREAYRRLSELLASAIAGREDSILPEEAGYRWAVAGSGPRSATTSGSRPTAPGPGWPRSAASSTSSPSGATAPTSAPATAAGPPRWCCGTAPSWPWRRPTPRWPAGCTADCSGVSWRASARTPPYASSRSSPPRPAWPT